MLLRLAKDDDDRERTADLVRPVLKKDPRLASGISKQMFKIVFLEKLSTLHIPKSIHSVRFNLKPLSKFLNCGKFDAQCALSS